LLFGDESGGEEEEKCEKKVANISLESEPEVRSDSENSEKENEPEKPKQTAFGTARVITGKKQFKKEQRKRTFVDDEGNMVTEKYFVEIEVEEGAEETPSPPKLW